MEKAIKKAQDDGNPVQEEACKMMFDFLASIDTAKNGELSAEEVDEAADMIRIVKQGKLNDLKLNYKHLPKAVRDILEGWDSPNDPKQRDGTVDAKELEAAAEAQKKMSKENRLVKKLLVGAIIVVLLLSAGTFALSLTAAEMAKETKASPNGVIET